MKTTKIILSIYFFIAVASPFANAELAAPTTGASSAPWPTEQQYCDSLCPSLAGTNGQALGLSGSGGWSTSDDQWCANHNAQTSPTVLPSPAPIGATLPAGTCTTAQMYPGDTSCAQTTAEVTHCQYHNSQTESYCMAYEGAKVAGGGEKTILALDIAATSICAVDCAAPTSFGGNIGEACEVGATVAGAAEIIVTLTQQSSTMGKIADLALGGAGVALGVRGLMNAGGVNACGAPANGPANAPPGVPGAAPINAPPMIPDAPSAPQLGPITPGPANGMNEKLESAECFLASLFIPNAEAAMNKCQKNACITAVAMAALTGVRYCNMGFGERTQKPRKVPAEMFGLSKAATRQLVQAVEAPSQTLLWVAVLVVAGQLSALLQLMVPLD